MIAKRTRRASSRSRRALTCSRRLAPMTSRSARSTAVQGFHDSPKPYRKGWQLAIEEINAKGGVDSRKLVVISQG